jgi:outer membrane protein OmpA-like peptidoglycan-associated protein
MRLPRLFGVIAVSSVVGCSSSLPIHHAARRPISSVLTAGDRLVVDRPLPTVARDAHDTFPITTTTTQPDQAPSSTTTTVPPPPHVVPDDVLFDTGSSALKPEAAPVLSALVAEIQQESPGARVVVTGHTDSRGTVESNQALSVARAAAVAAFMSAHGLKQSQVNFAGSGESAPVANDMATGHYDESVGRRNRRVEIQVLNPPGG